MKAVIFTFFILFLALLLEVSLAIYGLVLPLLMFEIFYLTVVRKWRFSFLTALVVCAILDNLLGYYSLPSMTFVIVVASFWRHGGDCSRIELQFFPISLTLFFAMLILMGCVHINYGGVIPLWDWLVQLAVGVVVIGLATPFIIKFQDWLAGKLKILTYTEVQREELYNANK